VLGDFAHGTTVRAARERDEFLGHLGKPQAAVVHLTVGFRVPEAVAALANQGLDRLGVGVAPARSLRRGGELRIRPAWC
jgi:rhodanese-related sulfurtransferase